MVTLTGKTMSIFLNNKKTILITASLLVFFAVSGAALVGLIFDLTIDDIIYNEKLTLLKKLNHIIPASRYNNDLILDTIPIEADTSLGTKKETLAYRARKDKQDIAVVLSSVAPDGYNGPIKLLVGIYADGTIAGIRVVKQRETPGLGDAIETSISDWILGFNGKTLQQPDSQHWKVKRDGGIFDQFTGATITPRAVVKAVHNTLIYFDKNHSMLFQKDTMTSGSTTQVPAKPADKVQQSEKLND